MWAPGFYANEEGYYLRLMMAAIMVVAVYLGITQCREGAIDKRLRDEEAREARAVKSIKKSAKSN